MHRRMRQLSLTETNTFVNLAKHALEPLNASDDEDAAGKDEVPGHYSDDGNTGDDNRDDDVDDDTVEPCTSPTTLKSIRSEPVFKKKRKKRLGMVLGMDHTEEAEEEEIEMENRWLTPADTSADDMLQFVARSTSDIEVENVDHRDDGDDAEPSGDETTHLAPAKNLLLC